MPGSTVFWVIVPSNGARDLRIALHDAGGGERLFRLLDLGGKLCLPGTRHFVVRLSQLQLRRCLIELLIRNRFFLVEGLASA